MDFRFEEATREAIKLRMALKSIAGGGKTYTALALMSWILGEPGADMTKKIALIDTERGSSRRYAKGRPFHFSVLELKSFEPESFVKAIRAAADAGFEGVIIDSLSHEWVGTGGALEQSDTAKKRGGNGFAAWGDITKRHNAVLDAITDSPIHVIATMRTKTTYEQTEDAETKKKTVRKLGLQPVQRDGVEYEFDILLDLDADNVAYVEKTRCQEITGKTFRQPGKDLGKIIRAWLEDTDTQSAARPAKAEPPPAPAKLPAAHVDLAVQALADELERDATLAMSKVGDLDGVDALLATIDDSGRPSNEQEAYRRAAARRIIELATTPEALVRGRDLANLSGASPAWHVRTKALYQAKKAEIAANAAPAVTAPAN